MISGVLVLGGGPDQLPAVHAINELGLCSIVVDSNPDCVSVKFADYFFPVSNRNPLQIVKTVSSLTDVKVELVFVIGSDIPHIGSEVSKLLSIDPLIKRNIAELSIDKLRLKHFLKNKGFLTPGVKEYTTEDDLNLTFPCIVKPNKLAGSRGVFFCSDKYELRKNIKKIKNTFPSAQILLEEYVEGIQLSSEHIVFNGEPMTFGLALRDYESTRQLLPYIIENGGTQCHPEAMKYLSQVNKLVNELIKALSIANGVLKFDLIIKDDDIYILEMATRMSGGDFASSIIPESLGFNYIKSVIGTFLGIDNYKEELFRNRLKPDGEYKFVSNKYIIPFVSGSMPRINWPKENYLMREIFLAESERFEPPTNHSERLGVFVLSDDNLNTLNCRITNVYNELNIC